MQCKDLNDRMVLMLIMLNPILGYRAYDILASQYPYKVVYAKFEKLSRRGLIEYGTALTSPWITDKGKALI